jgi:hypothetical protein
MMHVGLAGADTPGPRGHHQALERGPTEQRVSNVAVESTKLITRLDEKTSDNPPCLVTRFLKLDRHQSAGEGRFALQKALDVPPALIEPFASVLTVVDVFHSVAAPPMKPHLPGLLHVESKARSVVFFGRGGELERDVSRFDSGPSEALQQNAPFCLELGVEIEVHQRAASTAPVVFAGSISA